MDARQKIFKNKKHYFVFERSSEFMVLDVSIFTYSFHSAHSPYILYPSTGRIGKASFREKSFPKKFGK